MPVTVAQLLENARARHWAFASGAQMPDGALLSLLNERQRSALLHVIEEAEQLVGEARELATAVTGGQLVGLDSTGTPAYSSTATEGYAITLVGGVPTLDTSLILSADPFGLGGAIPGLPLPDDILRVVTVIGVLPDREHRVDIVPERGASRGTGSALLRAFVNGNRLVPIRQGVGDLWGDVTHVRLSMVRCPILTALTDTITLPAPFTQVLTAALVELLAGASTACPEADRRRFTLQRQEAEADLTLSAASLIADVTQSSVVMGRR